VLTNDSRYQNFKRSIEYMLRNEQMTVEQIYNNIRKTHSEDCDDEEPCKHKGKFYQYGEWKHLVRGALQGLKKQGTVGYNFNSRTWIHL
jgi:hypothetical protein